MLCQDIVVEKFKLFDPMVKGQDNSDIGFIQDTPSCPNSYTYTDKIQNMTLHWYNK